MAYKTRSRYRFNLGSSLPPGVRWLLIANVSIWLLNVVCELAGLGGLFRPFGLSPYQVFHHFAIWQLGTYMFLHSWSSPFHILFNMLSLWWAGTAIEQTWGTRKFLKFYFTCGIGAGFFVLLAYLVFGGAGYVIGASGAVLGLLVAFAMLFPDQTVIFFFFPIKAKYLVMILAAIAIFPGLLDPGSFSFAAHAGGLVTGFAYLRLPHLRFDGMSLNRRYEKWRIDRAKRKFQVYMRKQDSKREPWVH